MFKYFSKNWHYFYGIKKLFIFSYLLKFINIFISLLSPIFLSYIINDILNKDLHTLIFNLSILIILELLNIVLSQFVSRLEIKIKAGVNYKVKIQLLKKFLEIPPCSLKEYNGGKIFSLILNDSSQISNYAFLVLNNIFNLISIIGIGIIIFIISWQLSFIVLVTYPVLYIINRCYGKKIKIKTEKLINDSDDFVSFYKNIITNADEIKFINGASKVNNFFALKTDNLKNQNLNIEKLKLNNSMFCGILGVINTLFLFFIAAILVLFGNLNIGSFIAFNKYSSNFTSSLNSIVGLNASLQPILVTLERLEKFDNLYKETVSNKEVETSEILYDGEIEFQDVKLVLDNKIIFEDLNLTVKSHSVNGIFGKNGSGKTSILNLLTKIYEPDKGIISLNGSNIKGLSYKFIQNNISYIKQNPMLFNMSLLENILLFNNANFIPLENIQNACKEINFLDDINNMPNGFNTVLNDKNRLSVGQTQKLQIARAILMDRPIILIDEATVNLDTN